MRHADFKFAAVDETSNAMALDGIMFEGVSVRVRRPTDYNPVAAASLGPSEPNPNLNVQAIGLQPGGSGMVSFSPAPFFSLKPSERCCTDTCGFETAVLGLRAACSGYDKSHGYSYISYLGVLSPSKTTGQFARR